MKKVGICLTAILVFFATSLPLLAQGYSLTPGIEEYTLSPGETGSGAIQFINREGATTNVEITADTYDPQTEEILTKEPFVTTEITTAVVSPGQSISINYTISIPAETPVGSYFNILTVQETSSSEDPNNSVSVRKAVGAIIALHVVDSGNTIENIFFQQSNTQLVITNKGFPYISDMEIEYTYTNNSNFVFRPEGEIRLIDCDGKQVTARLELNSNKKAVYPGDSITETASIDAWSAPEVLESREVIARTYSGYGDNFITNKATVTIKTSAYIVGATTALLLLTLVGLTLKKILQHRKKP